MKKTIFFIFYIFMILQSCEYAPPRYGLEFNDVREEIGLPILPENWEHHKTLRETGSSKWTNPDYDNEKPCHFKKTVVFNEDTIIWESNQYLGQQKFNTIDGTIREELLITYHFIENEEHNIGWEYVLLTGEKADDHLYYFVINNIAKEEADSILVLWGFPEVSEN